MIAAIAHLIHPKTPHDVHGAAAFLASTPSAHLLLFVGLVLLLLGMPGLYARVSASTGALALLGFALLFVGVILNDFIHCPIEFGPVVAMRNLATEQAGELWLRTYHQSPFAIVEMVGTFFLVAGAVLFLIGTRNVASLSKWPRGRDFSFGRSQYCWSPLTCPWCHPTPVPFS